MKTAQVVACDSLAALDGALLAVRSESTVCIVAAVTEPLVTAQKSGTLFATVDHILSEIVTKISSFCLSRPALQLLVAPPLYRSRPSWFHDSLAQISARFSATFSCNRPPNLHLMPSFISQDLMPDGQFLTPVSGLHFVLHLFDQADIILADVSSTSDSQLVSVKEVARHHDDRISYLEHRHENLVGRFSIKVAKDSEFDDWMTNRSEEDWLTIQGLPRISCDSKREWQQAAKKQVKELIRSVLQTNKERLDYSILFITNPRRFRTGPTLYNVKLSSVGASKQIRDLYSGFFCHHNRLPIPEWHKHVSVRNKVTLETRVRMRIMHVLGERYQDSNRGGSFKVNFTNNLYAKLYYDISYFSPALERFYFDI